MLLTALLTLVPLAGAKKKAASDEAVDHRGGLALVAETEELIEGRRDRTDSPDERECLDRQQLELRSLETIVTAANDRIEAALQGDLDDEKREAAISRGMATIRLSKEQVMALRVDVQSC